MEYEEIDWNDETKQFQIQLNGIEVEYHPSENKFYNLSLNSVDLLDKTEDFDKDNWDALTDGQYGDYPGPGFDDYDGMGF